MKLTVAPLLCCLLISAAYADDNGGLKKDAAPPPPHSLDEGYRGTEDARTMTVEQAKEMHDGATISLRGNLIDGSGGDKFKFRDKPAQSIPLFLRLYLMGVKSSLTI